MNVKNVEKQEKNMVKLTIEIEADEFDAAIEKVYRKTKSQLSIPGFRKGKAPRKLIEKMYGADLFYEDAINDVYPKAVEDAVTENDLEIVGYPETNVTSVGPEGVTLIATIATKPEVKVENYKGVVAPYQEVEVTDKDVDIAMVTYINRARTTVDVDDPAEKDDTVTIDFVGYKNGEEFEGGKAENYDLTLGSNSFIPGFEDQLIGVKAGEEREVHVTFPENYGKAELNGADATFKVKVHAVKRTQEPVLDDEFAKDVSEFDTLDELKAHLREECRQDKEKAAQKDFELSVMDQLIDKTEIDVPDTMVKYEVDRIMDGYKERLVGAGVTLEQYIGMTGATLEQFMEATREDALRSIKGQLILESIADQESIEINDEDIDKYAEKMGKDYGMNAEEMKSMLPEDSLKTGVRIDKTAQLVYDAAIHGPAPEVSEKEATD